VAFSALYFESLSWTESHISANFSLMKSITFNFPRMKKVAVI
jgi:hypothetical protein